MILSIDINSRVPGASGLPEVGSPSQSGRIDKGGEVGAVRGLGTGRAGDH